MALTIGSQADIKLLNVTIQEFSPDNSWVRVTLQPDPVSGATSDIWIPNDARVSVNQSLPASWPPQEGDIWTIQGQTNVKAAVMGSPSGQLYFVLPTNVLQKQTPATIDQALARFGSKLQLLSRVPA